MVNEIGTSETVAPVRWKNACIYSVYFHWKI